MLEVSEALRLTVCLVATALLVQHHRAIADAIEAFKNHFGGGPPSPPQPLPGRDHRRANRKVG